MNTQVISNYSRLKPSLLFIPFFILISIVFFLYTQQALNPNAYIHIQKSTFLYINAQLAHYPGLLDNFTQLGNALIDMSFLSIFIYYAPAIWESLISGSLISLIVASSLKKMFTIPRPEAALEHHSFNIIGQHLSGHNSLPSGHSITIFTTLTVLMFALMPRKIHRRYVWIFLITGAGLLVAFTRVGIGAHYPLDVLTGSTVGFACGLTGILLNRKYNIWAWVGSKKFYPFFIFLLIICGVVMMDKILEQQLMVYYLALAAQVFTVFKLTNVYFKK